MSGEIGGVWPVAGRVRRIYTRSGDQGQTRLLSGETLEKDDLRVNTYGTLDELQSHLGMARALMSEPTLRSMLYAIQKDLFVAGSELASTPTKLARLKRRLTTEDVSVLEAKMDQLAETFGIPGSFVIPGASSDSAALHVARSVCRRVERLIVQLNRSARSYQGLIVYFNRLSDLLFVMAWSATVNALAESVLDELVARRK
jgi:cob(I)alamin adenosyltransferase